MKTSLLRWFDQEKRSLPWRESKDPYAIWLSEIILQQTRVDQGLAYFNRFLKACPDVFALANATEDQVLKLWQGLGYYSRARNLHHTAKFIVETYQGVFPADYHALLSLKGIGPYTAAAIASIAFDLPHPVCDGNVERVVTRLLAIKEAPKSPSVQKQIHTFLNQHIDHQRPGDFNQAMMELGALICKPSRPECPSCPVKDECKARKLKLTGEIPFRQKKEQNPQRFLYYLVVTTLNGKNLWMRKRDGKDIWKGLYEFPLIETTAATSLPALKKSQVWQDLFGEKPVTVVSQSKVIHHKLTHRELVVKFLRIEIRKSDFSGMAYEYLSKSELSRVPVPQLIANYLQHHLL